MFPRWEPAARCSGGPTPGAQALMRWIMEEYGPKGAQNWGIYNCRTVRGGATTSIHGEGRALDVGFAVGDPHGDELLKKLLPQVGRLGIQAIIYERRIYTALTPGGRPYTGVAPHYDHLHIELTREAGNRLTYATVKSALTPKVWKTGERRLREGAQGADVRWVQTKLGLDADGVFGPRTKSAVQRWRTKQGLPADDGVIGRRAWKALGVLPTY